MDDFRRFRQLSMAELADFGDIFKSAEDGRSGKPLSADEVRRREMAARVALEGDGEKLQNSGWADVYHRLIHAGWAWRIAAYVAWASTPKVGRWPRTQEALAREVLGLTSDRRISEWRRKYPEIDEIIADLQAEALLDARADVIAALKQSASNPSYRHASDRKLYLEMTGDYIPVNKLVAELRKRGITEDDLSEMSDEDLRTIVMAAKRRGHGSGDDAAQG